MNSREVFAETGIRAEYGADLTLNLGPKAELKGETTLFEKAMLDKTFMVGVKENNPVK